MNNFEEYVSDINRQFSIVCHRGLWGKYPENSISAIKNAIDNNFSIVEIDVRRSLDGEFFLMHDEDLNRTTNISGKVSDNLSSKISDAFLKKNKENETVISDEKVPMLIEVLEAFKTKAFFDIDVKDQSDRESLINFIHENEFEAFVDVKKPLQNLAEANEFINNEHGSNIIKMIVLNITNQPIEEIFKIIDLTKPKIAEINFHDHSIFQKVLDFCLEKGVTVWVNTLNDVPNGGFTDKFALWSPYECWGVLIKKGVSIIQTDYPTILKNWYQDNYFK